MNKAILIQVEADIQASVELVWKFWTSPEDILLWNFASGDWHTTKAENDLKAGGHFLSRMEAKDGSFGFDFSGIYDHVEENRLIEYTLGDNRKVRIIFESLDETTRITQIFEAETTNSTELQRAGWQAILDNFKNYVEANKKEWPYLC